MNSCKTRQEPKSLLYSVLLTGLSVLSGSEAVQIQISTSQKPQVTKILDALDSVVCAVRW